MPLSAQAVRVVSSGMAALPVTPDFWPSLAFGHRMEAGELFGLLRELRDAGIVAGFGGEIDPSRGGVGEAISERVPEGAIVRWAGAGLVSHCVEGAADGWAATRWFKIGAHFARGGELGADPFARESDRTLLVREEDRRDAERSAEQDRVFAAASVPIPFEPPRTPWEQIAERAGVSPDAAREAVVRLVLGRRWRRFALRANLAAAGWRGCGLGCWRVGEASAERAVGALASVSATGDACIRMPTAEFPFDATALVLAAEEGAGERVASRISEKWGVALGRWIAMADLSSGRAG